MRAAAADIWRVLPECPLQADPSFGTLPSCLVDMPGHLVAAQANLHMLITALC